MLMVYDCTLLTGYLVFGLLSFHSLFEFDDFFCTWVCHLSFFCRSSSVYGEYSVGKLLIFSNGWHNNHRVQSNAYAVFEAVAGNSARNNETIWRINSNKISVKFIWFHFVPPVNRIKSTFGSSLQSHNTLIKTPEVNGAHFHGNKNELGNHFITFYYFNNEMDGMNHHPHKHLSLDAAFIIWCDPFNGILMCLV